MQYPIIDKDDDRINFMFDKKAKRYVPSEFVTISTGIVTKSMDIVTQPTVRVTESSDIVTKPTGIVTQPTVRITESSDIVISNFVAPNFRNSKEPV